MKATFTFNLNDPDDRIEHLRCVKATDMATVLWEIHNNSRKTLEREIESKEIDKFETLDLIFSHIDDIIYNSDINPDKLIQ